jgi:Rha family phage regulatory protein
MMNTFNLTNYDGKYYADSREVAEKIERTHNELLKSIRTYIGYLGEGKIPQSEYFVEATYRNEQNKELPCYLITKKGCDMIANKLTGKKGVLFTAAYVSAFEQMKQQIENHSAAQIYSTKATSAGEVASLIRTLRTVMKDQKSHPAKIAEMAEDVCHQFGVALPKNFVETSRWEQLSLDPAI